MAATDQEDVGGEAGGEGEEQHLVEVGGREEGLKFTWNRL